MEMKIDTIEDVAERINRIIKQPEFSEDETECFGCNRKQCINECFDRKFDDYLNR